MPELQKAVEKAGFKVETRYGVFMDIKHIGKSLPAKVALSDPKKLQQAIKLVRGGLEAYYDNDAISCIFAPLYPDHARNNLWVCRRLA